MMSSVILVNNSALGVQNCHISKYNILIFVIQISLIKPNRAQNETSSESKMATSAIMPSRSKKIMTQTERQIPERNLSKRVKFVVTRKPPINFHRHKHQSFKKNPLMRKIYNIRKTDTYIRPKKLLLISHMGNLLTQKKYIAKPNQHIRNSFVNKINSTNILSQGDNDESIKKQTHKAVVCNGPELKNIVSQANIVAIKDKVILNNSTLKDLLQLRKCLLRLKGMENTVLSNKRKHKRVKLNGNLKSNEKDTSASIRSSKYEFKQHILRYMNNLRNKFEMSVNDGKETTENIDRSRSKRHMNIIEEESVATTLPGFKFTGRDLSLQTQLMYRNIHN
ncbi:unnamed protein product [Euphydryas editha]|uniref:Ribosomal protein S4 n=1 Tax=Euphydryas editha TaxID=104508 RepID=A0AAU9TTX3_EUPED|nr:unnamed protein product [Euphydryas editha]